VQPYASDQVYSLARSRHGGPVINFCQMLAPVSPASQRSLLGIPAFALHTWVAYTCALRLSPWLVFHFFGWVGPLLHISFATLGRDWYLQHLELATVFPAAIVGYLDVVRLLPPNWSKHVDIRRHDFTARWAWVIPSLILGSRMAKYDSPHSVLIGGATSAIAYFFDIQQTMPGSAHQLVSNFDRVWAQMTVTAPFYAGIAYSVGALASRYGLVAKLFMFERVEQSTGSETEISKDHDPKECGR